MTNTGLHRRTQCAVSRWDGRRIIRDVIPTKTPGLVLVYCGPLYGGYTVTHQRSGCRIGDYYATVEEARDLAVNLGFWTADYPGFWAKSKDEIATSPDVLDRVRRYMGGNDE